MRKLFDTISRNLSGKMIGHAINLMRPWADACGKTENLKVYERAYQQVVDDYMAVGQRAEQHQAIDRIVRDLYVCLDTLYQDMRCQESTAYEIRRLLQPVHEPNSPETAFDYFWLNRATDSTEMTAYAQDLYMSYLSDPEMEDEAMMAVSGLTMRLLRTFSVRALQLLMYAAEEQYPLPVRERAWVGIVLVMMHYDVRMSYYPELLEQLQDLILTDDGRVLARSAQTALIHTTAIPWIVEVTDDQQKTMQSALDNYLRNHTVDNHQIMLDATMDDDFADEETAQLQEAAMSHFSEVRHIMRNALDYNYPIYKRSYHTHFFSEPYRFFLPFDISYIEGVTQDMVDKLNSLPMHSDCASDRYLVLSTMKDLLSALPSHLVQFETDEVQGSLLCNGYVQQLYRFFTLNPWDIDNPMERIVEIYKTQVFAFLNPTANDKAISAHDFYVAHCYEPACMLYEWHSTQLDEMRLRELVIALQRCERYEEAIQYYKKMEPTDWVLRQMAVCYSHLKQYDDLLLTLEALLDRHPDDINYQIRKAKCLLHLELLDEATDLLCQVELQQPGIDTVQRNLTWAYFLKGDLEKATIYNNQLMDNKKAGKRFEDYMNTGHISFCMGYRADALQQYVLAARQAPSLQAFLLAFRPDRHHLVDKGISRQEIYLMEDQIITLYGR